MSSSYRLASFRFVAAVFGVVFLTGLEAAAQVTNPVTRWTGRGDAVTRTPDGQDDDQWAPMEEFPGLTYAYGDSASAGAGGATASASGNVASHVTVIGGHVKSIMITASMTVSSTQGDHDPSYLGGGGFARGTGSVQFQVLDETLATISVTGAGGRDWPLFRINNGSAFSFVGYVPGDGGTREVRFPGGTTGYIELSVEAKSFLGSGPRSDSATATMNIRFRPAPKIALRALEVTQVTQDWSNSVPLIAGKRTFARAFCEALIPEDVGKSVTGYLRGFRNGVELPGSPRFASIVPGLFQDPARLSENALVARSNADNSRTSLTFELPAAWTSGTVELQFEPDSNGVEGREPADAAGGPARDGRVRVTFQNSPKLRLAIIPMGFSRVFSEDFAPPAPAMMQTVYQDVRLLFPTAEVDIQPMASVTMVGSFSAFLSARIFDVCRQAFADNLWIGEGRIVMALIRKEAAEHFFPLRPGFVGGSADEDGFALWAIADSEPRFTAAHELGHALARPHAVHDEGAGGSFRSGYCGEKAITSEVFPFLYPVGGFFRPTLGPMGSTDTDARVFGLDTIHSKVVFPSESFDLMSYCRPRWISSHTYRKIREEMLSRVGATSPQPAFSPSQMFKAKALDDYLIVRGVVNVTHNQVEWLPSLRRTEAEPTPPAPGEFQLRFLNDTGAVLSESSFAATVPADSELLSEPQGVSFSVGVTMNASLRRVELLRNGALMASRDASMNPPTVQVTSPNGGETVADPELRIQWQGSDLDGGSLTYTVQYSSDNGATWQTLATEVPENTFTVSTEDLGGSAEARVRVLASDEFWCASDASDATFTVADKGPLLFISHPSNNATFYGDSPVLLEAWALDREQGVLGGANVEWRSDQDGVLGQGEAFELSARQLSEGHHQIIATARDSAGNHTTATNRVTIVRLAPPDLRVLEIGGNGFLTLEALGAPTSRLLIETSTDLERWSALPSRIQLSRYELIFEATGETNQRFYRALSAPLEPVFTRNDSTNFNGLTGTNLTLSAAAIGQGPLTFQWHFNNQELGGATNGTLALTNLGTAQSGSYFLVVSNVVGVITGSVSVVSIYSNAFQVLHSFAPTNSGINGWGKLTVGSDGAIYGCARGGGTAGAGAIFRYSPAASNYTILRLLDPAADGATPLGGVIEGSDGFLYGTTFAGGENNSGTIFKLNRNGSNFTVLHHFASAADCRNPQSELLEVSDGFLYGTAYNGGGFARGGVFRIKPDGSSYSTVTGFGKGLGDDPRQPVGGLIQGIDQFLYGTSEFGGSSSNGCVFRLSTNGSYTVIKSLGIVAGGSRNPNGTLFQFPNASGTLLGTSANGGTAGFGTLFTLLPDGSEFEVLHNFGAVAGDGRNPTTGLIRTAQGKMLGTTRIGGAFNQGTIYQLSSLLGNVTVMRSFTGAGGDAARSRSPLADTGDGFIYSSTFGGGANDQGVVFRMLIP